MDYVNLYGGKAAARGCVDGLRDRGAPGRRPPGIGIGTLAGAARRPANTNRNPTTQLRRALSAAVFRGNLRAIDAGQRDRSVARTEPWIHDSVEHILALTRCSCADTKIPAPVLGADFDLNAGLAGGCMRG